MEKKKNYGIFHISDAKNCIISFGAVSFDILTGTAILAFKDEYGAIGVVHHLEPGHYVTVI